MVQKTAWTSGISKTCAEGPSEACHEYEHAKKEIVKKIDRLLRGKGEFSGMNGIKMKDWYFPRVPQGLGGKRLKDPGTCHS